MDAQAGPAGGVCAVVLAAGRGSRFGGEKVLAEFRGEPLLAHIVRAAAVAVDGGWLDGMVGVIPPGSPRLREIITAAGGRAVELPRRTAAMATSLRLGLDAAAGAEAAMIFLGDQPLVRAETIELLVAAHRTRPDAVIRPRYEAGSGEPGHPVLVPNRWWPLLRGDEGDQGFGTLLRGASPHVELAVAGHNPDIDTLADLERLVRDHPGAT